MGGHRALLRCRIGGTLNRGLRSGSDRVGQCAESGSDPPAEWGVVGEFVVSTAEVLHEGVPGDQGRWVGMGDVKLAAVVGLITGWYAGLLALAVANALVVVAGLVLRKRRVPLGPFLAIGLVTAVLFGPS